MFDLTSKVALVTGGRRGMGKSHALVLAKQGAAVAVTDIDKDECQEVVDEIIAAGGEAAAYHLDVSSAAEVTEVFAAVVEKFGGIDILINNAGIYQPKAALEMTEEDWERTIHINLKGQFLCAQAAAKVMAKKKWGRIINIASIASGQTGIGIAGGAAYTASKGGILGMTETLATEWASAGILVNAIAPGAIDTPMAPVNSIPQEILNQTLAKIPLQRFGKSEEVSAAVVFLASEEASYVTGTTVYVDGGWLAA